MSFFKKKNSLMFLFFIIIIGSYFRFIGVFTNSFAFTYDVGRDILAVEQMLKTHKPLLIGPTTGLEGVFYGPTWYYILAVPFVIFGGNPQGLAFFIALTGICSIVFAYMLGKMIKDEYIGLLFAAFIAVSPSMIGIASQIWSPNLVPLFLFPSLFLTTSFFQKRFLSKKQAILLGIFIGLLMEMGFIFGILYIGAFFIAIAIYMVRQKMMKKELLLVVPGILVVFIPRFLFELRHQFLMTHSFMRFFTGKTPVEKSLSLADALTNRGTIFFNTFSDALVGNYRLIAGVLLFTFVLLLLRYFRKLQGIQKDLALFSLSIIATYFIVLIFFPHDIFAHYLVGIPIFILLLVSIAVSMTKKITKWLPIAFTVFILLLDINPPTLFSGIFSLWEGNAAVYRNQLAVVNYVYKKAKSQEFNYIAYTPAVYDYNYRYLFSWYGKTNYGYSPSMEKKKLFFVVMEPDYERPARLTRWLEVREGDGKILHEEVVKGGIIVQVREH